MRIISVQFKNLNSLKGEHTIHFDKAPLKDAGIFAITGPTGSGKTTILDAISLALYNRTPRTKASKGDIQKSGALLTRNTKEAYSAVEYECRNGRFISKWSIAINRNGNLNEAKLELAHSDGTIITTKKNQVRDKNKEYIGLSYEQFMRSILLAQGEFSKFLKASKNEQSLLLETITGTSIYRKIGKKAYDMYKEYGKEFELLLHRKAILSEKLIEEGRFAQLNTDYDKYNKTLGTLETKIKELEKNKQSQLEIKRILQEIDTTSQVLKTTQKAFKEFQQTTGIRLTKHRSLSPVMDKLRAWQNQTEIIATEQLKLDKLEQELELIKKEQQHVLDSASSLVQNPIKNIITDLSAFESQVLQLSEKKDRLGNEFKAIFAETKAHLGALQLSPDHTQIPNTKKELDRLIASTQKEYLSIQKVIPKDRLQSPQKAMTECQAKIETLNRCVLLQQQIEQTQNSLSKLKEQQHKSKTELEKTPSLIKVADAEGKKLQAELDSLRKDEKIALLEKELADHRHILKDGQPCPLCGALKHPYSVDYQELAPSKIQKKISQKSLLLTKSTQTLATLKAIQDSANKQLKTLKIELQKTNSEAVNYQQNLGKLTASINFKGTHFSEAVNQEKENFDHLQKWQLILTNQDHQKALGPLLDKLIKIIQKGKEIKMAKDKLFSGTDIRLAVSSIRDQWNQLAERQKSNIKISKEIATDIINKTRSTGELQAQIEQRIKHPIVEAILDILPESNYEQFAKTEKDLQIKTQRLDTQLDALQKQLKEKESISSITDIAQLGIQLTELAKTKTTTQTTRDSLLAELKIQNETRQQLAQLELDITKQEKDNLKWKLLKQYIGDATGDRFNSFAQELTLHQLLHLANDRLKLLNDRYQLSPPQEGEDDSLTLIDLDMGGERRSVTTLSGGEQFIISLALALGLSDLASRHIEINTLFIDEGFGSLDVTLLDQIIDTLEKLQTESNKTIGIISHVPALQERIATQIIVTKNGQGHSTIRTAETT